METASKKKKMDCSGAEFLSIDEGLCVQIMHIGAFDDEPATVTMMDKYLEENGYVNDFTGGDAITKSIYQTQEKLHRRNAKQ